MNENVAQEQRGHAPHEEREKYDELEREVEYNTQDKNHNPFHSNEEGEGYESATGNVSTGANDNDNADKYEHDQGLENGSKNEQNENCDTQGGYNSDGNNGWGSGGEHGDDYGPGHGEGGEDSNNNSENSDKNKRNGMLVDHAMIIFGINAHVDMNEQNLNQIYRRQMLNFRPDHSHMYGLSEEQATIRSQRLNDAVQEMRIHLNLPLVGTFLILLPLKTAIVKIIMNRQNI